MRDITAKVLHGLYAVREKARAQLDKLDNVERKVVLLDYLDLPLSTRIGVFDLPSGDVRIRTPEGQRVISRAEYVAIRIKYRKQLSEVKHV